MGSASERLQSRRVRTVLVVEDEVLIRMAVADYLRDCGYRVMEASNADEAITLLKTEMAVEVVFSDVNLPGGFNGFALAQWIRKERPGIRVILTSGIVKSAREAHELCEEGPLVEKPYDHREVERRIRSLFADRARRD